MPEFQSRWWLYLCLVILCSFAALAYNSRVPKVPINSHTVTFQETEPVPAKASVARVGRLSLQPEALKISRRLGRRFFTGGSVVLSGQLSMEGNVSRIQIARRQDDGGELVEVTLPDRGLSWDSIQGARVNGERAAASDRRLIERLTFDSVDQFVLAQLRGAAYQIIARNVQDNGAAKAGTQWTIVRLNDSQRNTESTSEAGFRLYFINVTTGLIDKIAYDIGGDRIEATFTNWRTDSGETSPGLINWTRNGQPIMQLNVSDSVSSIVR